MTPHLVHTATLEIGAADPAAARAATDAAVQAWDQQIGDALGAALDRVEAQIGAGVWDRVEVDLGRLPARGFAAALAQALLERLPVALASTPPAASSAGPPEAGRGSGGELHPGWAALHFLRDGVLPWWSAERELARLAQATVALAERQPAAVAAWLRATGPDPVIAVRAAAQLGGDAAAAIARLLDEGAPPLTQHPTHDVLPLGGASGEVPGRAEGGRAAVALQDPRWGGRGAPEVAATSADSPSPDPLPPTRDEATAARPGVLASRRPTAAPARSEVGELARLRRQSPHVALPPASESGDVPGRAEGGTSSTARPRREGAPAFTDTTAPLYAPAAGLVIAWAALPGAFARLGYRHDDGWSPDGAERAVLWLHFLARASDEADEPDLALPKLLCGLPLRAPVPRTVGLTEDERGLAADLLAAIAERWTAIGSTSPDGLRRAFLDRDGVVEPVGVDWRLRVERQAIDVLLDRLPWGISTVRLPWTPWTLDVEW